MKLILLFLAFLGVVLSQNCPVIRSRDFHDFTHIYPSLASNLSIPVLEAGRRAIVVDRINLVGIADCPGTFVLLQLFKETFSSTYLIRRRFATLPFSIDDELNDTLFSGERYIQVISPFGTICSQPFAFSIQFISPSQLSLYQDKNNEIIIN